MEKVSGIYNKLLQIQKKIIGLGKDKSTYSYKYVTGDKVLSEIKPMMNELGLLLKQEIISIENVRQDYTTKNGSKSEINSKVMLRFTWIDCESGEKDENLFGANGQNDWDKGVGSALTYGERYFLLKYFHIATDEDDIDNPDRKKDDKVNGTTMYNHNTIGTAEKPSISNDAFKKATEAIKAGTVTLADILKKYSLAPSQRSILEGLKEPA